METPEEKERQRLEKLAALQKQAMGASNGLFTGEDVIQAEVEIDSPRARKPPQGGRPPSRRRGPTR